MSGKAIRRRAKLVKAANEGNLAKAQKRKASANLPLPNAPTKEDYVEKIPASLRRLMALKAAAEQPKAKRQKTANVQQSETQQNQQQQRQAKKQHQAQLQSQDGQPQQEKRLELQPRPEGKAAAHSDGAAALGKVHAGMVWEQPKSRLKPKKKEYLKNKRLKKKAKQIAAAADKELAVDLPAFGEVVHQPPMVQLKRKHWDAAAALKAQHAQQQQQRRANPAKEHKQGSALLELREQVIESYRAGRGPREGLATMHSLKQLVK